MLYLLNSASGCVAVVCVPLVLLGFIDLTVSYWKAVLLCVRAEAIYCYV